MWMSRIQACKILLAFATKQHVSWRLFEEVYAEQSAEPAGTTCFLHLDMHAWHSAWHTEALRYVFVD